jgi:hypothetical protein
MYFIKIKSIGWIWRQLPLLRNMKAIRNFTDVYLASWVKPKNSTNQIYLCNFIVVNLYSFIYSLCQYIVYIILLYYKLYRYKFLYFGKKVSLDSGSSYLWVANRFRGRSNNTWHLRGGSQSVTWQFLLVISLVKVVKNLGHVTQSIFFQY